MGTILFGFIAILSGTAFAQVVPQTVIDPAAITVHKLNLALQEKHSAFMKLQMVQDALQLKNNYLQAKSYYDSIYYKSQHKGGLVGYYKDYFEEQLTNLAADQWRQLSTEANTITGPTAVSDLAAYLTGSAGNAAGAGINGAASVVGRGMESLDSGYKGARGEIFSQSQKQVVIVDKMIQSSEERGDKLKDQIRLLVKRGSRDEVDETESEAITMQAAVLQLQLLSDVRQLLALNAQVLNAQAKQQLAEMTVALAATNDLSILKDQVERLKKLKPAADSNALQRELRRRPNE